MALVAEDLEEVSAEALEAEAVLEASAEAVLAVVAAAAAGSVWLGLNNRFNVTTLNHYNFTVLNMYRRDLITAEIEKLAQVLARIIGLKQDGDFVASDELLQQTLASSFGLKPETLYASEPDAFGLWLEQSDWPAEKLDMLGQFLFNEIDPNGEPLANKLLATRLVLVYQTLASKHHMVHLANLKRQDSIQQYL